MAFIHGDEGNEPLSDFFKDGPGPIVETVPVTIDSELFTPEEIKKIKPGDMLFINEFSTVNPKDTLGVKKVKLHLIPPASKIYQATAMEDGEIKYGPYNWRKNKVILSIYLDAAERHLECYLDGEEVAKDSGVHHLAHVLGCIGIIIDAKETGNLIDDRPTKGVASQLINRLKKG